MVVTIFTIFDNLILKSMFSGIELGSDRVCSACKLIGLSELHGDGVG